MSRNDPFEKNSTTHSKPFNRSVNISSFDNQHLYEGMLPQPPYQPVIHYDQLGSTTFDDPVVNPMITFNDKQYRNNDLE